MTRITKMNDTAAMLEMAVEFMLRNESKMTRREFELISAKLQAAEYAIGRMIADPKVARVKIIVAWNMIEGISKRQFAFVG